MSSYERNQYEFVSFTIVGQCLQVGIYSRYLRVRHRLGKRFKPTFRLPFVPVGAPYGWIGVRCIDADENMSILRHHNLVDQLPVHTTNRFGEGKNRLFAGPR